MHTSHSTRTAFKHDFAARINPSHSNNSNTQQLKKSAKKQPIKLKFLQKLLYCPVHAQNDLSYRFCTGTHSLSCKNRLYFYCDLYSDSLYGSFNRLFALCNSNLFGFA